VRAKSGPAYPNEATAFLRSGADLYRFVDYGEGDTDAYWTSYIGGTEYNYRYDIGNWAYEWHTFGWMRDSSGWWSLAIDGVLRQLAIIT
jgi:hypothetical protein